MKSFYLLAAAGVILAGRGWAQAPVEEQGFQVAFQSQDERNLKEQLDKIRIQLGDPARMEHVQVLETRGAVMGGQVKGAPYSGVEVNESNQMLADGTRIHNETRTNVYRDSEGRLRRETPTEITIWDPVANASYILDPQKMTARKVQVGYAFYKTTVGGPVGGGGGVAAAGTVPHEMRVEIMRVQPGEAPPSLNDEALTKLKAEAEAKAMQDMRPRGGAVSVTTATGRAGGVVSLRPAKTEQLGTQTMEGVKVDGTRTTSTLEVGAIGNDRPLVTTSERWYSQELQTVVMTRRNDPRTGEETFRLINVNRSEPGAYLFQVPGGYQVIDK